MLEHYMVQASSYADKIDGLVWLIAIIVGFWFVLAEGMFFWLIWKFRARPGHRAIYVGDDLEHTIKHNWVEWPHRVILLCDVALIVGAISVWSHVKLQTPPVDEKVRITVQQWAWTFQHAGVDGKLDTADDITMIDELHVELGKTYQFELTAKDVVHSFSVPVFRLKQDAIPGRVITGWFKPTKAGEHDIQCTEICGIGHGIMPAKIYIDYPEAHAAWLANPTRSLAANRP